MWEYIPERVKMEAEYILQTGATVRTCAAHFGVSKSTVHKDVTDRLKDIDEGLWNGVREVLDKNLSERHIRGGIATKNKYLHAGICKSKQRNSCCECRCPDYSSCGREDSLFCGGCGKNPEINNK